MLFKNLSELSVSFILSFQNNQILIIRRLKSQKILHLRHAIMWFQKKYSERELFYLIETSCQWLSSISGKKKTSWSIVYDTSDSSKDIQYKSSRFNFIYVNESHVCTREKNPIKVNDHHTSTWWRDDAS